MEVAICALDQPSDGKVTSRKGQNIPFDLLLMAHERGHDFPILAKPIHPRELIAEIWKYARKPAPMIVFPPREADIQHKRTA
jgi:hypothetical protein